MFLPGGRVFSFQTPPPLQDRHRTWAGSRRRTTERVAGHRWDWDDRGPDDDDRRGSDQVRHHDYRGNEEFPDAPERLAAQPGGARAEQLAGSEPGYTE